MSLFQRNPRFIFTLGALSIAAALTACGGGDDPVNTGGEVPAVPPPVVTTPAEVFLPGLGTSTGLDVTGTLNYLVFSPVAPDRTVSADVAIDGDSGTLTLKDVDGDLVVSTSDAWRGSSWPAESDGLLTLNGNAGLICNTTDNSGQVGVSGNVKQVLDLTVLRGKTFQFNTCANGAVEVAGGITFNEDGSAVFADPDGTSTFKADEVLEYFKGGSNFGVPNANFKARAFYWDPSSGPRQYVILDITNDVLSDGSPDNAVSLMVEAAGPR